MLSTPIAVLALLQRHPAEVFEGGHDAHMTRILSKGWARGAPAPADHKLEVVVAVRQNPAGVQALERALLQVSEPHCASVSFSRSAGVDEFFIPR